MHHKVKFAPDDLMPQGLNFVLCRDSGVTTLYLRASIRLRVAVLEQTLEEAWEGFCVMTEADEELHEIPPQRSFLFV